MRLVSMESPSSQSYSRDQPVLIILVGYQVLFAEATRHFMPRGFCKKNQVPLLDDHRTVDVREDIFAHCGFVHHGYDRIVFHAHNKRVVACQHQRILRPF